MQIIRDRARAYLVLSPSSELAWYHTLRIWLYATVDYGTQSQFFGALPALVLSETET